MPDGPPHEREREFAKYPGFKRCYIRAFKRMLDANPRFDWTTGEEVFQWWMDFDFSKTNPQSESLFEGVD